MTSASTARTYVVRLDWPASKEDRSVSAGTGAAGSTAKVHVSNELP